MKIIFKKPYVQLVSGVICFLFLGLAYAWSVFVVPLELEFGWNRTQTSAVFTICMIFFYIGNIASGFIGNKVSGKLIMLCSALFYGLGFFCSMQVMELWQLYLAYGVCCGLGTGLGYNSVIKTVTSWFPANTGMASGTLLMGFGFGSMLLGMVIRYFNDSLGWRSTFSILCVVYLVVIGLMAIILTPAPKAQTAAVLKTTQNSLSAKEMLKDTRFYIFYVWSILTTVAGLAIFGHASACVQEAGASSSAGAMAVGLLSISNGIGRVAFGVIYDKLGRKFTTTTMDIGFIITLCILIFGVSTSNFLITAIGLATVGFTYGGVVPCMTAYTKERFGAKFFASNFSLLLSSGIVSSLVGPLIVGYIRTQTASYTMAFTMVLVLCLLSAGVNRYHIYKDAQIFNLNAQK